MTDVEFLQSTNILRLNSAAKMAGLRWKNGAPGYDKQGIIAKLQQHPSILRACIAQIQRLNREEGIPAPEGLEQAPAPKNPFADDILEEILGDKVAEVGKTFEDLTGLKNRVSSLETRASQMGSALATLTDSQNKQDKSLAACAAAIEVLQQRKPVQINIPDRPPILIDPDKHHASFPKLIQYLQINRRVILTGQAGTGKSMAVKNAAKALGVPFYLVPPVTMSHELIGHRDAQGNFHDTPLTIAYKTGGLCLLDEADASLPDALLCINPVLDGNGFATLGDGLLHTQHPDFMAVFNMNTDGNGATMQYAGRNRLDGATIARFGVRIHWDIDNRIEAQMAEGQDKWHAVVKAVRAFMEQREIVDVNATPRHTKTGAQLLNAGVPKANVLQDTMKNGAVGAVWADIVRLPAVEQFLRGF